MEPEAERHTAPDNGQPKVEQIGHRSDCPTDQPPCALDDLASACSAGTPVSRVCPCRKPPLRDNRGLHTGKRPAGLDDEVADVAGVTLRTVKEATVQDDASADPVETTMAMKFAHQRAAPFQPSGEGERLGVVVDEYRRLTSSPRSPRTWHQSSRSESPARQGC